MKAGTQCLAVRAEQARQRVAGALRNRSAAETAARRPYPVWTDVNVPETFLGFWTPPRHMDLDLGDVGCAPLDASALADHAAADAASPPGSPKKSNIEAGVTFARCCYAHGGAMEAQDPAKSLVCGDEVSFIIQAADQFDIGQTHVDDVFQVAMVPMPRSGLKVAPIGRQGGGYRCTFTPHYATPHAISVRLVGHTIRGSPFTLHVVAGATKEEHTFQNRRMWQQDAVVVAMKRAPGSTRTTALWSNSSTAIGRK